MSKSYAEKLKDPRWQKKRLEIMERDGWKCVSCGLEDNTLHVHHMSYTKGSEPWEYEGKLLVTLCEDCHKKEHEDRPELERIILNSFKIIPVDYLVDVAYVLDSSKEIIDFLYRAATTDFNVLDCVLANLFRPRMKSFKREV